MQLHIKPLQNQQATAHAKAISSMPGPYATVKKHPCINTQKTSNKTEAMEFSTKHVVQCIMYTHLQVLLCLCNVEHTNSKLNNNNNNNNNNNRGAQQLC